MEKGERIARGDKKKKICRHLFVEGWSTYGRRNNLRKKKGRSENAIPCYAELADLCALETHFEGIYKCCSGEADDIAIGCWLFFCIVCNPQTYTLTDSYSVAYSIGISLCCL